MNSPIDGPLTRRRFLAWSVALGALTLSACAPSRPSGPPPVLKLLQAEVPSEPAQKVLGEEHAAAAKAVGVTLASNVLTRGNVPSTLARATAADQLPDLLLVGAADLGVLSGKGLLVDARETLDRVAGLNGDLFRPLQALAAAGPFVDRDPGQPSPAYGVPAFSIAGGWLTRKDLAAAKGVAAPKSFAEWQAAATKLTDPAASVAGFGARLPPDEATDSRANVVLLAHGAPLFDADGFRVSLDLTAASTAFTTLAGFFQPSVAPAGVVDWSVAALEAAFASGHIAQMVDDGGSYGRLVRGDPRLRDIISVLPPPAGPKGWFTTADARLYLVPNRAAAERALALIEHVLQPSGYDRLVAAGDGAIVPPYAYVTKGPFWDQDPNYQALFVNTRGDPARSFQYANPGSPAPLTPPVALAWQNHLLADAVRSVVLQQQSPAVAAKLLRDRAASLVPAAVEQQPTPAATPEPGWLRWLRGL